MQTNSVPVIGFVGARNSGKTTLATKVVAELARRGLKVGVVKHTHHFFDLDKKGKDSWKYTQAGADAVVLAGDARLTMFAKVHDPELSGSLALLQDKDVIVVEGFTRSTHDRIWVYRSEIGGEDKIEPYRENIVAVASDGAEPLPGVSRLDIDDVAQVTRFVIEHCRLKADRMAEQGEKA